MEVFVSPRAPGPYLEFNLAPAGQWAAYRFSGYRAAYGTADRESAPPRIELRPQADALLLSADVALPAEFGRRGAATGARRRSSKTRRGSWATGRCATPANGRIFITPTVSDFEI